MTQKDSDRVQAHVPLAFKLQFRMMCLQKGMSVREALTEAMVQWMARQEELQAQRKEAQGGDKETVRHLLRDYR